MARIQRMTLPGIAQHVVQREELPDACFFDDDGRLRYLQLLRNALHHGGRQLHAFVQMNNHVHLLVTPSTARALPS